MTTTTEILKRANNVLANFKKSTSRKVVMRDMTPEQFVDHAKAQLAKAETETGVAFKDRIALLTKATTIMKAESFEDTETAKIPVFEDDTTSASDKTDKTLTSAPDQPEATQFSANSTTEFTAKSATAKRAGVESRMLAGDDERTTTKKNVTVEDELPWPEDLNATPVPKDWGKD